MAIDNIEIETLLPIVGAKNLAFRSESRKILECLDYPKEKKRLESIPHLGVACYAFDGINHSRWEYFLLRCSIIEDLAKNYKGHEVFSLSSKVKVPGFTYSSGEELLKSWVICSSSGHPKHTYSAEKALMKSAQTEESMRCWLLSQITDAELREKCADIIDSDNLGDFHYLLAAIRVCNGVSYSRGKKVGIIAIKIFLNVGCEQWGIETLEKVERLRGMFNKIRSVATVSMDSYYSHIPISYDLHNITGSHLFLEDERFWSLVEKTNKWMSDVIYRSPKALGYSKSYEMSSCKRFSKTFIKTNDKKSWFSQIMRDGGQSNMEPYKHLLRIDLPDYLYGAKSKDPNWRKEKLIWRTLGSHNRIFVSIHESSGRVLVDYMYARNVPTNNLYLALKGIIKYLVLTTEKSVLGKLKKLGVENEAIVEKIAPEFYRESVCQIECYFFEAYKALVGLHLGKGFLFEAADEDSLGNLFYGVRMCSQKYGNVDTITSRIVAMKDVLTADKDSLFELTCLYELLASSDFDFMVAVFGKQKLRKMKLAEGRHRLTDVDEWDGGFITIKSNKMELHVLECKNTKPTSARSNVAFKQLDATIDFLRLNEGKVTTYRRKRLSGVGAYLRVTYPV